MSDKIFQEDKDAIADEESLFDGLQDATSIAEGNTEETNGTLHSEELDENTDFSRYRPVTCEDGKESPSDEGWQEANSKGRSRNTAYRKFSQRQPLISKLSINTSENYITRESGYRSTITSPPYKRTPKSNSSMVSPPKQSRAQSMTLKQNSANHPIVNLVSKISSTTATLSSVASKSISYKEVVVAPPATALKPLLEKAEVDVEKPENDV